LFDAFRFFVETESGVALCALLSIELRASLTFGWSAMRTLTYIQKTLQVFQKIASLASCAIDRMFHWALLHWVWSDTVFASTNLSDKSAHIRSV
jgi:hypothetical protein